MNYKNYDQKIKKTNRKKLDTLQEFLSQISDGQIIDSNDPDTWDSDTLYSLAELQSNGSSFANERQNLKKALKLLQDQKSPKDKDEFGEPLILEEGLCSLVDSYWEEDEDNDYYD